MADWKIPVSYNYSPSYHAYAYGLMYPQGPEQNHPTMSWAEAAYGPTAGITGGFFPPQAQSLPGSPECGASNTDCHYPSSVVYYADSLSHTQSGRPSFSHNRNLYNQEAKNHEQAGTRSDTPSDSEAHTPDSWSSGSSREGGVPRTDIDPPIWLKKERAYKLGSGSPDGSKVVSSSLSVAVDPSLLLNVEGEEESSEQLPVPPRKAKARTAFSEGQMNALTDRFNMQRYLTPAEMKTLAGLTGLTYKQVKTWFQNRRMKLKRHQKDNSWVSDRYFTVGISSAQTSHSQFQVDASIPNQDLFTNPQVRDAVFKKSPPESSPFCPNYTRPLSASQLSNRPQGNWPLPPAVTHFEFPNPPSYLAVGGNTDGGGGGVDSSSSPMQLATVHNVSQWLS